MLARRASIRLPASGLLTGVLTGLLTGLLVAAAVAGCAPAEGTSQESGADQSRTGATAADVLVPVELATVGMDALQGAPIVLLREAESGRIVPIWVGIAEAQAILRTMLGIEMPRPMTHDLMVDLVQRLGAAVEEVVVHDVRETTFIGKIRLRVGDEAELRDIDSRPSDALALAIRTDARIRVAEALLSDPPEFDFLAPEADEQVVRILGATVVSPTPGLQERFQLPDRTGLVVVGASGVAADHGLRRGDMVLEVNGMPPTQPMDFLNAVLGADDGVSILFWRDGQEHQVELPPAVTSAPDRRRGPTHIQT